MCLLEIEAAHAFHIAEERDQLELDADPVAPLSLAQNKFMILHGDLGYRFQRIHIATENGSVAAGEPLRNELSGPIRLLTSSVSSPPARDYLSAFDRAGDGGRIIGVEGKCAVGPAQVGSAHAGQRLSLGGDGRKVRRNTEDCVGDSVLIQDLPEGGTLSELFGAATSERNRPIAKVDGVLGPSTFEAEK